METLKQNYNKLVKETLTVEDPRLKKRERSDRDGTKKRFSKKPRFLSK